MEFQLSFRLPFVDEFGEFLIRDWICPFPLPKVQRLDRAALGSAVDFQEVKAAEWSGTSGCT
jgi:hypothetical protein